MEYDFFNEEITPTEEEKPVQRDSAPLEDGKFTQKKKKPWWKIVLAVGLAIAIFFLGYLTSWAALDPEIRTLLKVKDRIQKDYYKEVTDEAFYKAIFGGINDDLLDEYSGYMTPEEFAAVLRDLEGNRSGIGLVFSAQKGSELRIMRVCGGSPAEKEGILSGDTVLAYGKEADGLTPCATFQQFSDGIAGYAEGEPFFIKLQSGGEEKTVNLAKAQYVENYVFYRTREKGYTFVGENSEIQESGASFAFLPADTAYIQLIQFTGNAAKDFDRAMAQFKADGKKNLVLDLRMNGGGYLDCMQSIASYFCKNATVKKPVVAVADFGERRESYKANGNYYAEYFAADSRITVLADNGSASASECLIGSMLDYGAINFDDICLVKRNGIAKTFGKGIMQETSLVNLLKQDALKLTTAEIRWPVSDRSIHGRGVLPEDGALGVEENLDYTLETKSAIEKLCG